MKELKLWQEAVALAAAAVRLARGTSKRETKVLTDRLMLAAADVASRVARGYAHDAPPAQLGMYLGAREALVELETLLSVGRQAGLFAADAVAPVTARANTVHRLLTGYVAYVDRQVADSGASSGTPASSGRVPSSAAS